MGTNEPWTVENATSEKRYFFKITLINIFYPLLFRTRIDLLLLEPRLVGRRPVGRYGPSRRRVFYLNPSNRVKTIY